MKLTVTKKLYLSFIAVLALLLMIGVISQFSLKTTDDQYQNLINDRVKKVTLVKDIINSQKDQTLSIRGYLLYGDASFLESYDTYKNDTQKYLDQLRAMVNTAKGEELLNLLAENIQMYNDNIEPMLEAKQNSEEERALALAKENSLIVTNINSAAKDLIDFQESIVKETTQSIDGKMTTTTLMVWILTIGSFIIGGVVAYVMGRSIANPIHKVSEQLRRISDGDLTIERISVKNRDEIGEMVQYLNTMVEDLREIVSRVNHSALEVSSQSQELSASSEESSAASQLMAELAQANATGSDKQLSVISGVTKSVKEMTEGIEKIAGNSNNMLEANKKVVSLIKKGSVAVDTSSNHMNELNSAMKQISQIVDQLNHKSNEISNITNIINGIADQTNLLALNAAIEAARAGEAGKGFAVVADEVRMLAEQSKVSSGQIAQMIQSIQSGTSEAIFSIEKGNQIVGLSFTATKETSEVFHHIDDAANELSEQISSVAEATKEIKMGVNSILHAVEAVQEVAQLTAGSSSEASAATEEQVATMEQISASAQSLSMLAEKLQSIVSTFKV